MIVRKCNAHLFDVFLGIGWNNWIRVKTRTTQFGTKCHIVKASIHCSEQQLMEIESHFNTKQ
jgi:hypothetical protein